MFVSLPAGAGAAGGLGGPAGLPELHTELYFLCGGPKTKLRSPTHTQINTKSSKNRLKVKPFK